MLLTAETKLTSAMSAVFFDSEIFLLQPYRLKRSPVRMKNVKNLLQHLLHCSKGNQQKIIIYMFINLNWIELNLHIWPTVARLFYHSENAGHKSLIFHRELFRLIIILLVGQPVISGVCGRLTLFAKLKRILLWTIESILMPQTVFQLCTRIWRSRISQGECTADLEWFFFCRFRWVRLCLIFALLAHCPL